MSTTLTKHYGHVTEEGRLHAPSFAAEAKGWPVGTPLELTVRKAGRRTTPQNSYLHVLFGIAAQALNDAGFGDGRPWTKERVKELMKQEKCYPVIELVMPGGDVREFAKDTRELDKEEAGDTIERVIQFFAMYGIELPAPGEQQTMEMR